MSELEVLLYFKGKCIKSLILSIASAFLVTSSNLVMILKLLNDTEYNNNLVIGLKILSIIIIILNFWIAILNIKCIEGLIISILDINKALKEIR